MSTALASPDLWAIGPISSPRLHWGARRGRSEHRCPTCKIALLTGEDAGFCCGPGGTYFSDVSPLPPLPLEFTPLLTHPGISAASRSLNLIFSFASLETTAQFSSTNGPPGFMAIQGKIYHR
ncbi:uncharacterized protein B0H18DRAFT_874536, partial [Fomitopsis serialis]|uniref:uncharacterized protein n=1 Tax=Fomitopsis serialis TaxID=139415 RepID=UPI002007B3BA